MVVLGSAGALRVTLVTSAGIRGTGWGPGVSSRTIMACSRGGKRQNKKSSKKYKKLPSYELVHVCTCGVMYNYIMYVL